MTTQQRILIVDDEVDFAKGLARLVTSAFPELEVSLAHSGSEALDIIDTFGTYTTRNSFEQDNPSTCANAPPNALGTAPVGVMLLDLNMPGMHGLEVMQAALEKDSGLCVIVLTAHGTVETAVTALKNGAWDFLTKPVRREDLLRTLAKGCERNRLLGENQRLRSLMAQSVMQHTLMGDSPAMRKLKESISAVSPSSYTVLIRGESGTGKELVAEAIHKLSSRKNHPFVGVNCPAIPEQLLESELFGHVKGAFTGATCGHKGLFTQAANGSLVLDEIGDIPPAIQTKLLRVLQDGEVRPVGATQSTHVDTRIIAITNQDLEAKIKEGSFREDLFYRLNVLTLRTPPLREHKEDIPLLAAHFLHATCADLRVDQKKFSPAAVARLCQRDWPGNVRELQNFIRRAAVFSNGPVVEVTHLCFGEPALHLQETTYDEHATQTARSTTLGAYKDAKNAVLDAFTRNYMDDILQRTGGNVSEAARISGIERVSLQKILRRLSMDASEFRKN